MMMAGKILVDLLLTHEWKCISVSCSLAMEAILHCSDNVTLAEEADSVFNRNYNYSYGLENNNITLYGKILRRCHCSDYVTVVEGAYFLFLEKGRKNIGQIFCLLDCLFGTFKPSKL